MFRNRINKEIETKFKLKWLSKNMEKAKRGRKTSKKVVAIGLFLVYFLSYSYSGVCSLWSNRCPPHPLSRLFSPTLPLFLLMLLRLCMFYTLTHCVFVSHTCFCAYNFQTVFCYSICCFQKVPVSKY